MLPSAPRVRVGRCVGVVGLLLLFAVHHNAHPRCGPNLDTPGVTIPQGDIVLQEGTPLELFCILNITHKSAIGRNASHLMFFRNQERIGPDHLEIINETTLRLYIERPKVSESMFYCKLKKENAIPEAVCLNTVAVGYQPLDVENLQCVSYNWQQLTCRWDQKPNPVKTKYRITYRLPGRAGGRNLFACPEDTDVRFNKCTWNETSSPPYRQPYEFYFLTIHGENVFNNTSRMIKFHHYAHVLPAKPENLVVVNKTAFSALIRWDVPYPLQNFPPGLTQRVEYLPQWETRLEQTASWHAANTSGLNPKNSTHELFLSDLQYANTLYDIRVYLRSAKASDDTLWSAPSAITVKTLPSLPGSPPKTNIGSYEIFNHVNNRDIYLYWQTIPDYLQNGDNFRYQIVEVEREGVPISMNATELRKMHARFTKADLYESYRFRIVSVNNEGQSINRSEIFVPGRSHVPRGPSSVTRVYYEKGIYELSWKPPEYTADIKSYTLFWCDSNVERMCNSYLEWITVPSNTTMKNITVQDDKSFQFAVSANTLQTSSGMVWASCTILYNKPIQKMKNVWVKKVDSTSMELVWNLDCLDRNGLVNGFRIYYCPVQHKGPKCKSPQLNVTEKADKSSTTLTGLRPYTTYSVSIAVLTRDGEGLPSDPLLNVTLEGAPSTPPQNVTVDDVSNSTITVSWNAPEERNGVITKYEVHYDGKVQTKDMDPNEDFTRKQRIVLGDLTSYYNYSVSVRACTVACSDKSAPLIIETKVGVPGQISIPHVTFINASRLNVSWDPPSYPAGTLDYYEIMVKHPGVYNSTDEVINTTRTSLLFPIVECSERRDEPYQFFIRAVNVDPITNKALRGNWSLQGEGSCYQSGIPQPLKIMIYILCTGIAFVILVGFAYLSRRTELLTDADSLTCSLPASSDQNEGANKSAGSAGSGSWFLRKASVWMKCKDMRDVEVKLPPGLVPPSDHERDQDFNLHQWVTHNHDSEPSLRVGPAADEERLLQQKEDHHERNLSGDSSGCSSGHDSVSSSTTSGTHISADSGTEVDQHERGFADPSWEAGSESNSLRQRNVNGRQPWEPYTCVGTGSAKSTPNLTELEPALPGGYAVLGLNNWASHSSIPDAGSEVGPARQKAGVPQQVSRGYVALDAASSLSPSVASPSKPTKPEVSQGYVAHPPSSDLWAHPVPAKGYVTTGEKQVSSEEEEGDWEALYSPELQRLKPTSGEYGMRPSRTEPSLGNGYVMTGEKALRRDRHKAEGITPTLPQQTMCYATAGSPVEQLKPSHGVDDIPISRTHEYVMTGERELVRNPPLLMLDPDPHKAYCLVSEREPPVVRPAATSGYVPHRQLETHSPSSVVE